MAAMLAVMGDYAMYATVFDQQITNEHALPDQDT
jgi:hypothetical protein